MYGRYGRWLATCAVTLWTLPCLDAAEQPKRLRPLPKLDQNMKTGPAIGAKIPEFTAVDQNGKRQTFQTMRGPKGLVLQFVRSADW